MSKKRIALILSSLLGIFLISACILWHCSQSEDKRFEAFLSSFFSWELSGNSLTLHYTLKDPSAYGLEDVTISGSFSSDSTGHVFSLENTIKRVSSFDRSRLSSENQLTYDVLLDYLNTSLKGAPYLLYNEPLTPLTGIQSQLPILLSEYPFYDRQDVDSYLALLSCIPDYFNELLVFEQKKSDAGFFMSSSPVWIVSWRNVRPFSRWETTATSTTPSGGLSLKTLNPFPIPTARHILEPIKVARKPLFFLPFISWKKICRP